MRPDKPDQVSGDHRAVQDFTAFRPAVPVTISDLSRLGELAQDLNNPEVMGRAWS
ncbi:hypothetical protein [Nocardia sp. NPDC004123]